jgi:hypothetical protein
MTTNISTITMLTADRDPREPHRNLTTDIVAQTAQCARGAVYLSGPMSKLNERSRADLLAYAWKMSWFEQQLVQRDWVVFNPYASVLHPGNFDPKNHGKWIEHDEYLMNAAKLLVNAGLVDRAIWLGCPGWIDSVGSKQEMGIARELNMELIEWKFRFGTNVLTWRNVAFVGVQ